MVLARVIVAETGASGIIDSGVSGLSVMTEIVRELPQEDVLFFADSAHCPYGRRTHAEIQRLAQGIVAFLLSEGAKIIVVTCKAAPAASLSHLRETFEVAIVGMEPAVEPAAERTDSRVVGAMATEATFQGALFTSLLERFAAGVEVLPRTCPGLVGQVEAGLIDAPSTRQMLETQLEPLVQAGVDSPVFGLHACSLLAAFDRGDSGARDQHH